MVVDVTKVEYVPDIHVSGCFVECNNKVLMLRRSGGEETWCGYYGLPSGKVDGSETYVEAMVRELYEETGIHIVEDDYAFMSSLPLLHHGVNVYYHLFYTKLEDYLEVKLNPKEHDRYDWLHPDDVESIKMIEDLDECFRIFKAWKK